MERLSLLLPGHPRPSTGAASLALGAALALASGLLAGLFAGSLPPQGPPAGGLIALAQFTRLEVLAAWFHLPGLVPGLGTVLLLSALYADRLPMPLRRAAPLLRGIALALLSARLAYAASFA